MSTLDDARKLVQDIVAPDLKALSARMDALEKAMKAGFEASEKLAEVRHEIMLLRIETVMQRTEAGFGTMNVKFEGLVQSLSMERG